MRFWQREGSVSELKTQRLRLVAVTPKLLAADAADSARLGSLLRGRVTPEWPPADWEPHVLEMIEEQCLMLPSSLGWHRYALLKDGWRRTLIGCLGAFPKADGEVEIGYSTLPAFQRKGYGSEAAAALVEWLLQQEGVRSVTAQTFATRPESVKVMERCGMVYAGSGDDAGTVRYRRQR